MDIFTTQLTRVVQTPVKKADLKVKALIKEAGIGKLKEDHDHLENHEYYFKHRGKNKHAEDNLPKHLSKHLSKQSLDEEQKNFQNTKTASYSETGAGFYAETDAKAHKKNNVDDEEKPPHLDIFV
ncbi:MAG: hypothetical protein HRT37_08015 [Alteromonadaceae bacterium]|nr:hypothetical protein [Alteromonadaceae bacterium]